MTTNKVGATSLARSRAATGSTPIHNAPPPSSNYHAHALARGLALLEQIGSSPHPQTLNDLSDSTNLPKSTVVRLLSVLSQMEYTVRVDDRPAYRLGHMVQRLANSYVSALDLSVVAESHLSAVAQRTGQTTNLGVLDGSQVLHICVSEPERSLRFTAEPGSRDHAYCTGLGKLLLAGIDRSKLASVTPPEPFPSFTENTITTLDKLKRDLARIAQRGWALDDNERSAGLRCVAVPVKVDGEQRAAVSVSGPSAEFTPATREFYIEQLNAVADDLRNDPDFVAAIRIVSRSLRSPGSR
jgi:DNA-binding IclR family transcriptional regulator